jgi:hypothetical protein
LEPIALKSGTESNAWTFITQVNCWTGTFSASTCAATQPYRLPSPTAPLTSSSLGDRGHKTQTSIVVVEQWPCTCTGAPVATPPTTPSSLWRCSRNSSILGVEASNPPRVEFVQAGRHGSKWAVRVALAIETSARGTGFRGQKTTRKLDATTQAPTVGACIDAPRKRAIFWPWNWSRRLRCGRRRRSSGCICIYAHIYICI